MNRRCFLCAAISFIASKAIGKSWTQNAQYGDFWQAQPVVSCCGVGDAYAADYWEGRPDGSMDVWLNDGEEGQFSGQYYPIEGGTKFHVDREKIKYSPPNPTGHGILFVGQMGQVPYCYFPPGGA